MNNLKLFIISTIIVLFTGCGGGGSSTTPISTDLQVLLKDKTFYTVKDSVDKSTLYKIVYDINLTKYDFTTYGNNFNEEVSPSTSANITVTTDSFTDAGGTWEFEGNEETYINLTLKTNSLVKLKLFDTASLAEDYYKIDLRDKVKNKEFFVVQNTLTQRSLIKFNFSEDLSTWDVITYNTNFNDDNITGTLLNTSLEISEDNLTVLTYGDYRLNSKEPNFINLVNPSNSDSTFKLYDSSSLALEYFGSLDLRDEVKNKTFYAVKNDGTTKSLFKFEFGNTLTFWLYNIYSDNYNNTATSGTSNIKVTENILTETSGDSLKLKNKTTDYLELQSLSNSSTTYRFYNTQELAESYFTE